MTTPIFYAPEQNVSGLDSFSPSAGKPKRFTELMQQLAFHTYGQGFHKVEPITKEDLYQVHFKDYVDDVFDGTILNGFECRDARVPESCLWTIGSLLAASKWALLHPAIPACSPTSGFHHAGLDWGGGYCTFNGLAVVAAKLLEEHPGIRIGILDCDLHYGDGTSDILKRNPEMSLNAPHLSQGKYFHGDFPVEEAQEFGLWLDTAIDALNSFQCDLVLYQAGADPHIKDPMGGFLSTEQLIARDKAVFQGINAPIAWNLAGGYQSCLSGDLHLDPVLAIHRNTLRESDLSIPVRKKKLKEKSNGNP